MKKICAILFFSMLSSLCAHDLIGETHKAAETLRSLRKPTEVSRKEVVDKDGNVVFIVTEDENGCIEIKQFFSKIHSATRSGVSAFLLGLTSGYMLNGSLNSQILIGASTSAVNIGGQRLIFRDNNWLPMGAGHLLGFALGAFVGHQIHKDNDQK